MKLNYKRTILVGFAFFLISAFWQAYDAIVPLILTNHFGLDQFWSGGVMALDNVLAVVLLPLFGALSDKVMTRWGKRTPFIFIGTICAVVAFISLIFIDNYQFSAIMNTDAEAIYQSAAALREEAYELMTAARTSGDEVMLAAAQGKLAQADAMFASVSSITFGVVRDNVMPLVAFIGTLLLVLISMAIFRSPAVALMPDVTVKPLRSKGNAIINLMGTAGGIIVLALGMLFSTNQVFMNYTWYVAAVCSVMLIGLGVFVCTVKENRWAEDMRLDTLRYNLEAEEKPREAEDGKKRKLSKSEMVSLILILASVALWYIGYNSITSKYSVYATRELGFDYSLTLIVAQAAAVVAYIPVGIISSKIGRKKAILAGIIMLASAFTIGIFITPVTPEILMYPVFALAGIGWATINVNSFPMVVELARGGDVGKYTGYYYTASMAAQIVAPILSGLFYNIFGMRYVFFTFGAIFVVFSFVTMFFVRHGDSKPEKQGALEALAGADD